MSTLCVRRVLATAILTTVVALAASSPVLARNLHRQPARRPAAQDTSILQSALSALGGLWTQVTSALTGDNGAGIDPNGIAAPGDNGAGIDPNGITGTSGDNGAGIDPNG